MDIKQKTFNALNELIPMISSFKDCEKRNQKKPAFIDMGSPTIAEDTTQENCQPLSNGIYDFIDKLDRETLIGIRTLYINCRTVRESDDNPMPTEEEYEVSDFVQTDKNKYIFEDDFKEFANDSNEGLRFDVGSHCFAYESEKVFKDGIQKYGLRPSF